MITALVMGLNENLDGLLDQCLRQLLSFNGITQLLFVDNGSIDGTLDVAEWHDFEIVHHEWTGDHAAARNAGLAKATGDWIIVTDPDELWDDWYVDHLADYLAEHESDGVSAYLVPLHNFLGDHHHVNPHWQNTQVYRIFRRGLTYSGALHETPQPLNKVVTLEHRLFHYGWARGRRYLKSKLDRRTLHDGVGREPSHLDRLMAMAAPIDVKMPSIFTPGSLKMYPEWEWENYYDENFNPRKETLMSKKKLPAKKPYVKPAITTKPAPPESPKGIIITGKNGIETFIEGATEADLQHIREVFQNNNNQLGEFIPEFKIGEKVFPIGAVQEVAMEPCSVGRKAAEQLTSDDLYHARFDDFGDRIVRK